MKEKSYEELGLSKPEYERIVEILGREPNYLELNIFAAMWSEHCSYKSSKDLLKMFPNSGPAILQGPGENAGIFDIGDGLAVAMKIESHNHPSAVEPYQGAATGVGGIIRDIVAMGARPIALLNSLRFGSLDRPRVRYLFDGVVAGIAGFGNCIGIPTIAGEVYFEDSYEGNPLINAMCVGIVEKDKILKSGAKGIGNVAVLVGSATGRDGMHGAAFASEELDEKSEERRPSVQVGDPFMGKLVMEACLEMLERGLIVSLQDMGAAGITSSTSEMAAKGSMGIDIHLENVVLREPSMLPYEIMVSESQERMLVLTKPQDLGKVYEVCAHWGVSANAIAEVTDNGRLKVFKNGELLADIPAVDLMKGTPKPDLRSEPPSWQHELNSRSEIDLLPISEIKTVFLKMLSSTNNCSKQWVYSQYDYVIGTNTIGLPSADSAVIRIKGTNKALAFKVDGNGGYCYLDPYVGGQIAVAEAVRNLVVRGARPVAITDCLNFGNPEKPEIYWQMENCVSGMADACRKLHVPIISGNVSLYNESFGDPIYPTPVVGIAGLIDDADLHQTPQFKNAGDVIYILGNTQAELCGSELQKLLMGEIYGLCPRIDLQKERALHDCLLSLIKNRLICSAHDISEGGIALAIAECCIIGNIGAEVKAESNLNAYEFLYSESQSRALVSLRPENEEQFLEQCARFSMSAHRFGTVGGSRISIAGLFEVELKEAAEAWHMTLPKKMEV